MTQAAGIGPMGSLARLSNIRPIDRELRAKFSSKFNKNKTKQNKNGLAETCSELSHQIRDYTRIFSAVAKNENVQPICTTLYQPSRVSYRGRFVFRKVGDG